MKDEYKVGNLRVKPAPGWLDVTNLVDAEAPPFTLAKSDGVGVLQVSVASHYAGKVPGVAVGDLRNLLADFALSRELGGGADLVIREHPLLMCAQSYHAGTQFTRVWYCSNGRDVALLTYVCERGVQQAELPDCEGMVANLEFE